MSKRFVPGRTMIYMFLPESEPYCNSRCTGCYVLASESFKRRVKRSEQDVIDDLRNLVESGYSVLYSTTEVLMNRRYIEMLKTSKSDYILTNGKKILEKPEVLDELKDIGVTQIFMTANFDNSGLVLPDRKAFSEAIGKVLDANMELVVRITLTRNNVESMPGMIDACRGLGIRAIQFLRFMPLEKGPETLDGMSTKRAFELLETERLRNPDIFLSAGGALGSQFRKRRFCCPAGKEQFVIGLDNRIYPCIYLTQNENALGVYENGEVKIERTADIPGNELDCPAYRYYKLRSKSGEEN
jgi:MoaA/NifB/PqqE/SkfB family radical SAM enzyme